MTHKKKYDWNLAKLREETSQRGLKSTGSVNDLRARLLAQDSRKRNKLMKRKFFKLGAFCADRNDKNPTVTGYKQIDDSIIIGIDTQDELCDKPAGKFFCRDNKGIPRKKMPQFEGNIFRRYSDGRKFLDGLIEEGVEIEEDFMEVCTLKPTQNQLEGKKVRIKLGTIEKAKGNLERKVPRGEVTKKTLGYIHEIGRPIIISSDGYVLDGHHKWAALLAWDFKDKKDTPVKIHVKKVNLPIEELYKKAVKSKYAKLSSEY